MKNIGKPAIMMLIIIICACKNPFLQKDDSGTSGSKATPITSVAITVTGPATGQTPTTTASGAGYFSVGPASWSPVHNQFLGSTEYTVTITLTSDPNYTFTGLTSPNTTINGNDADITANTGKTVTLSYTFAPTGEKTVTGISIKTQPTKLSYTHGETLDLSGIEVTLAHDDSTNEDVAFTDFGTNNISAHIEGFADVGNGDTISYSDHNGKRIVVSHGSHTANTSALSISKAALTISGVSAVSRDYDGTTTVALTGGSLIGVVGSDDVGFTLNGGTIVNANAEDGKTVTINTIPLTGDDAGNYTLTQPAGIVVDISSKTITISGATHTKPYDTTTVASGVSNVILVGVISPDTVTVSVVTAVYTGANAGTSTINISAITLSNANYTVTVPVNNISVTGGGITKADGASVETPAVNGTPTTYSISVNTLTAPVNGQTIEYASSTVNNADASTLTWQAGTTFTSLDQGTTYCVYARAKENTNYNAGAYSVSEGITTAVSAGFEITFDQIINDEAPPLVRLTPVSRSTDDGQPIFEVTSSDDYETINWYVTGTGIEYLDDEEGKFIFTALDFMYYANGTYFLTLEVEKDGNWYNTTIEIVIGD